MPTIVTHGDDEWPYAVTHRCGNCGTEYRFERGDHFDRLAGGYEGVVSSFCPTCCKAVYTTSPHKRPRYREDATPSEPMSGAFVAGSCAAAFVITLAISLWRHDAPFFPSFMVSMVATLAVLIVAMVVETVLS